jgi:hypothetical protein
MRISIPNLQKTMLAYSKLHDGGQDCKNASKVGSIAVLPWRAAQLSDLRTDTKLELYAPSIRETSPTRQ